VDAVFPYLTSHDDPFEGVGVALAAALGLLLRSLFTA
jgi:hypothetical protein